MEPGIKIRRAKLCEGPVLSDLALRSKAYWGYDAQFIEKCRSDLTVSAEYIQENRVFAAWNRDELIGFYSIILEDDGYYLDNMFLEPQSIGEGIGKYLWNHALNQFKEMSVGEFKLVADPFAADFYAHMGAVQIAEKASSTFPGRVLPLMVFRFGMNRADTDAVDGQ